MKISIDDEVIFTLTELQKKVIQNEIYEEIYEEDIKRRVRYYPENKYEQCFKRMKEEWVPRLLERNILPPKDEIAFAELVFSQPDYLNRSQREK